MGHCIAARAELVHDARRRIERIALVGLLGLACARVRHRHRRLVGVQHAGFAGRQHALWTSVGNGRPGQRP